MPFYTNVSKFQLQLGHYWENKSTWKTMRFPDAVTNWRDTNIEISRSNCSGLGSRKKLKQHLKARNITSRKPMRTGKSS
jgi:hypothetical protein